MISEEDNFDELLKSILVNKDFPEPRSLNFTENVVNKAVELQLKTSQRKRYWTNTLLVCLLFGLLGLGMYFLSSGFILNYVSDYYSFLSSIGIKFWTLLSAIPIPVMVGLLIHFVLLRVFLLIYFFKKIKADSVLH